MIREAEENAEADKLTKQRIEAKNKLESYLYSLRSSCEDTLKDSLSEPDKELLLTTVKDALTWLEAHQQDEKDVYDNKYKEVESIANPIITKAYNAKGTTPPPTETSSSDSTDTKSDSGPTVEEVDED